MKTFKKIVLLALAVVMVFSMVACNEKPQGGDKSGADATPKPTPAMLICDLDSTQLDNYFVKYSVIEAAANGESTTSTIIEVSYSGLIINSVDGGQTYTMSTTMQSCFSLTDANTDASVFARHLLYTKDQLVNEGTETVAGIECTNYLFKNGLFKKHIYVDESFNTTGMTLKFVDETTDHTGAVSTKTIVVEELKFGTIDEATFGNFNLVTPDEA